MNSLWSNALLILACVALLWLGSAIIARMRREATTTIEEPSDADPLAPFQEAYRRGQMSDDEFLRIAEKVAPGRARALLLPRTKSSPRGAPPSEPESPPVEAPLTPEPPGSGTTPGEG